MFIIRLAAEALSLSERNERVVMKPATNDAHTAEPKSTSDNSAALSTDGDSLDAFTADKSSLLTNSINPNDHSETEHTEQSPSKAERASVSLELSTNDLSIVDGDGEKSSILYDLLSGRENVNTACHRSRLFLFTTKRQSNGHNGRPNCESMRRRKPLRPVKNVNISSENYPTVDSLCKSASSNNSPQPGSSFTPFYQQNYPRNSNRKLRMEKLSNQLTYRSLFGTRLDRIHNKDRVLGYQASTSRLNGRHCKNSSGDQGLSESWRNLVADSALEQPLDLSAPKSTGLLVGDLTNRKRKPHTSCSAKKFRKRLPGYCCRQERLDQYGFEGDRTLASSEMKTTVQEKKFIIPPPIQSLSAVTCSSSSIPLVECPNPLIPGLMNVLFNQSSHTILPGLSQLSHQNSGIGDVRRNLELGYSVQTNINEQTLSSQRKETQSTHSIEPKPLLNSDDITRFLEVYAQLTCLPNRSPLVGPKCVTFDKIPSRPQLFTNSNQQPWRVPSQHGRMDPVLGPTQIPHAPRHNPRSLTPQDQSTPVLERLTHPLVDRILSTFYGINPAVRDIRIPEAISPPSAIADIRADTAGPSSPGTISSPTIKADTQWSMIPPRKRSGNIPYIPQYLDKLRSDPIFSYLVQFIKRPEALLMDCFSPIHAGMSNETEESWYRDTIVQRLGLVTFQLLARTEADRARLFQDTWHLLYLLCVLERGKDTWPIDPDGLGSVGPDEDQYSWQAKLDLLSKLEKLVAQLSMPTQLYSLLRGLLLCHGKGNKVDIDAVMQQCGSLARFNPSEIPSLTGVTVHGTAHPKHVILKKLLHKLCSFHKNFIRRLFISPTSSSQAVECYLTNWIQLG